MASRISLNFSGLPRAWAIGRIIRKPLSWIPRSTVLPVLQGPLRGARWITGSATHGAWLGSYEADKQVKFKDAIHPGSVVYDIGANVGFYTLLASRLVGPAGSVYAFEPLPENVEFLNRHVALNHCANVTVIPAAVSSQAGEMGFSPAELREEGRLSASGPLRVRVVCLDDLVAAVAVQPPGLMKIDVEGAELDVLKGAATIIERYHPVIFLATHGDAVHRSCCEFMTAFGYGLNSLDGEEVPRSCELRAEPISPSRPVRP